MRELEHSQEEMIGVFERVLKEDAFENFVFAEAFSVPKGFEGKHTVFQTNRITFVMSGSLNEYIGSGHNYLLQNLPAGTSLVMKPNCMTDGLWNTCRETCGLVCLSDCLRLFYSSTGEGGSRMTERGFYYHISDTYEPCTAHAISTMCTFHDNDIGRQFSQQVMRLVFTLVLDNLKKSSGSEFGKAQNLWLQIRDYLYETPPQLFSRKHLAEHFQVTETYISRLFTRYSGKTFKDYLHSHFMEKAERLLENTNMNIEEIAFTCGYDSPSYFIHRFKELHNVSPAVWRCMNNKKM